MARITLKKDRLISTFIEECIPLEKKWLNVQAIRSAVVSELDNLADDNVMIDEYDLMDLCTEIAMKIDGILCCGLDESKIYVDGGSFNEAYWERVNKIEDLLEKYCAQN